MGRLHVEISAFKSVSFFMHQSIGFFYQVKFVLVFIINVKAIVLAPNFQDRSHFLLSTRIGPRLNEKLLFPALPLIAIHDIDFFH